MMELVDFNEIYGHDAKKTRRSRRGKKKSGDIAATAVAGDAAATATSTAKAAADKVEDVAKKAKGKDEEE
jgi:hypothetical protein